MTQEALRMALEWAEAHGEIVFAGGGMNAVNKMNSWVAAIKEALAQPQQEPVATLFGSLPVYDTTPPQRIEQDGQCKRCTDGCPACDATKLQKESHDLL
jgi:hypothetical protein